jgi:hypothetical protein
MLNTQEHVDLMAMFEREEKGARLTKEPKTLWRIGVIYQDGEVNARFLAYRRGYAFGKTVDSARSPDREAGSGTLVPKCEKRVSGMCCFHWGSARHRWVCCCCDRTLTGVAYEAERQACRAARLSEGTTNG